jgi:hypothetical protein
MKYDLAKVSRLADKLIGAGIIGADLNDELSDLNIEEAKRLDVFAFECVGCELWFAATERCEVDDKWYCPQCAPKKNKRRGL